MHIEPVIINTNGKERLSHYVIHATDGRTVEFQGQAYIKSNPAECLAQMREINKYLSFISRNGNQRCDQIFEGYQEVRQLLDECREPKVLNERVSRAVQKMYEPVVYEELLALCNQVGWVKLPPDMKTQLHGDDTPEKTYLRDDYIGLTALAIYVRLMVPIWGEYMTDAGKNHGTVYKEEMSLSLMNHTAICNIPAFERLEDYIRAQTGGRPQTLAMTIDLMSSEKIPSWMRAQVIVRRLAIRDLDKAVETTTQNGLVVGSAHLVTLVYSYINTLISDRRFDGPVREKKQHGGSDDDDSGPSVYGSVMVKHRKSPRIINADTAYIRQIERFAHDIEEAVPAGLATEIFDRLHAFDLGKNERHIANHGGIPQPISSGSRSVAEWIVNCRVPARSIEKILREDQNRTLAVAAAVLLTWEMPELAALVVGSPIERDDSFQVVNPLTQHDIRTIVDLYPHAMWEDEKTILPIKGLEIVAQFFIERDWDISAIGQPWLKQLPADRQGRMSCPPTIRQLLTQLIVKLNHHVKSMKGKI